jgi:hypothetical protein
MPYRILLLLVSLLAVSCAHDPRCEQACTSLRAVKPDKEGYLPRDKVLQAVGLSDSDFISYARTHYGTHLDHPNPSTMTRKTIDKIFNTPNRTASATPQQLESAVIVRKHQEICRVESAARRKEMATMKEYDEKDAR